MKVLLFGRLADQAGWREREAPPLASLAALRQWLAQDDPDLLTALGGPGVQVAVDKVLWRDDHLQEQIAEIAFLPPMSGG